MRRPYWRQPWVVIAAVAAAVVSTVAAVLLMGPLVLVSAGAGPVDGTVTVRECSDISSLEGGYLGRGCTGDFTPQGAASPQREISIQRASAHHAPGTIVPVRLYDGTAYEEYTGAVVVWLYVALMFLFPGWHALLWLFTWGRRHDDTDVLWLSFFGGAGVLIVLGCGIGAFT